MDMTISIIIVSVLASCITYYININLKKGIVMASAIVTLCSAIMLPYILPNIGPTLATVATTSSYAAMVSKNRFPKITDMIFIGIIVSIIFILFENSYQGVGGRLGTMAAISGFTWIGIKNISKKII